MYDEDEEAADEQGGSSHAHSGSGSQQYEEEQQQEYAAAVAAAAAAAGFGYATAEMQQPWVASLAAGMLHGALSTASDSAAHAAAQQYSDADQPQQQQQVQSGIEDVGEEDEDDRDGDEDAPSHHDGRDGYRSSPLGRYKSMPSKLGSAAAAAAGRCLKHTGSLPVGRRAPSSSCLSPNPLWSGAGEQQQTWSPSRLLLSPQAPRGRAAARVDVSKDVNDAEAEGTSDVGWALAHAQVEVDSGAAQRCDWEVSVHFQLRTIDRMPASRSTSIWSGQTRAVRLTSSLGHAHRRCCRQPFSQAAHPVPRMSCPLCCRC